MQNLKIVFRGNSQQDLATYYPSQIIIHDQYNSNSLDHDIALIKLIDSIKFDVSFKNPGMKDVHTEIRPSKIPLEKYYKKYGKVIFAGWGTTEVKF